MSRDDHAVQLIKFERAMTAKMKTKTALTTLPQEVSVRKHH